MEKFVWLIPAFPLLGVLINLFFGRWTGKKAHWVACMAVLGSFVVSLAAFNHVLQGETLNFNYFDWISTGSFHANAGVLVDPLSAIMLVVVTGVSFLIHVYSIGYMHEDPLYTRFFVYLNLFVFSMVSLVLANNFLLLYVFWEAVGLCSYLLIGFWFQKKSAADAGKKAFIVNRVGDFGFGLGIMMIFVVFGTIQFTDVFSMAPGAAPLCLTAITLLLLLGAMGKSAQIPLYVWLPDAMEGPTPVSALIHAATMVTAGVYMIARCHVLFNLAPFTQHVVIWMGMLTAFFAATIALVQKDIKRVLAYSTISQLGYMFVGVGLGAYTAGVFHLATHAFFKALLFLGAGSVMHAMANETDMWKMGGLSKVMKYTSATFLIACLAIAGIPPFAGFFSKEEILGAAWSSHQYAIYALGILTALMTAFYMFRAYFLTFRGTPRYNTHSHHAHESPFVMTIPLMVLAVFSIIAGWVGIATHSGSWIHNFLNPVFTVPGMEHAAEGGHSGAEAYLLMGIAIAAALVGIGIAWLVYLQDIKRSDRLATQFAGLHKVLANKYYVDEFYDAVFVNPIKNVSIALWRGFDTVVIDGTVNGIGWFVGIIGQLLRYFQSGYVRTYTTMFVIGVIAVLGFYLTR
jgi:NADH-quinone oxidoreductase subunit L